MIPRLILLATLVSAAFSTKCYKCESSQGDCNTGNCEGTWCTALITENKATRTRSVRKDCASSNPSNGKEDGCQKDSLPDGDTYRCGCTGTANVQEFCNSEANIARMQAMLNNQFALPGANGAQPFPNAINPVSGAQPSNGQPSSGQAPTNGQAPIVPPSLINPNSTFTDVIAGQPTLQFPNGNNPNQPNQLQAGPNIRNSPPQSQSTQGSQQVPPFTNQNQPQFPQNTLNIPPSSPNQNKPTAHRPGQPDTDQGFGGSGPVPGLAPNSNFVDTHMQGGNESNRIPNDHHGMQQPPTSDLNGNNIPGAQFGQSRSAAAPKNGQRTCACTEPACNGPCKGEACYQMMFSANDVHSQAFANKQGQITHLGCTDEPNIMAGGVHHAHRQLTDYKFKMGGQDITVPASAFYCNDNDYCNGAKNIIASFIAVCAALVTVVFLAGI